MHGRPMTEAGAQAAASSVTAGNGGRSEFGGRMIDGCGKFGGWARM